MTRLLACPSCGNTELNIDYAVVGKLRYVCNKCNRHLSQEELMAVDDERPIKIRDGVYI